MVSRENITELINILSQAGNINDLDIESPDLEDIFMKYYETDQSGQDSLENGKIKNKEGDR
jgi:hypothetical protein